MADRPLSKQELELLITVTDKGTKEAIAAIKNVSNQVKKESENISGYFKTQESERTEYQRQADTERVKSLLGQEKLFQAHNDRIFKFNQQQVADGKKNLADFDKEKAKSLLGQEKLLQAQREILDNVGLESSKSADLGMVASAKNREKEMTRLHTEALKENASRDRQRRETYKALTKYQIDLERGKIDAFGNTISQQKGMMDNFGRYCANWALRFGMMWGAFKAFEVLNSMTFGFLKLNRELVKSAEIAGMSTQEFQKLAYAGQMNLISTDKLTRYLDAQGKAITDLKEGSGDAAIAFGKLGLTYDQLKDKSPYEQLLLIADAFKKNAKQVDINFIATAIYQKQGREMIAMFKDGAQGIRDYAAELEDLGILMSEEYMEQSKQTAIEVERLKKQFEALQIMLGTVFVPFLKNTLIPTIRSLLSLMEAAKYAENGLGIGEAKTSATTISRLKQEVLARKDINDIVKKAMELEEEAIRKQAKKWKWTVLNVNRDEEMKKLTEMEQSYITFLTELLLNIKDKEKEFAENSPWIQITKERVEYFQKIEDSLYKYYEQLDKGEPLTKEQISDYRNLLDMVKQLDSQGYSPFLGTIKTYIGYIEKLLPITKDLKEAEKLANEAFKEANESVKEAGEAAEASAKQTISYRKAIEGITTSWNDYAEARRKAALADTGFPDVAGKMGAGFRQYGSEPATTTSSDAIKIQNDALDIAQKKSTLENDNNKIYKEQIELSIAILEAHKQDLDAQMKIYELKKELVSLEKDERENKYQSGQMGTGEAMGYQWGKGMEELGKKWGKLNKETGKYEASMSKMMGNITTGMQDILFNAVQPIGDAIGEWAVNGGKLGPVLKQILKEMLASIVSLIAQALIFEGILFLMNLLVPNSGTAFATGIAVAGGAITQGQGIDMSGFNNDANNAKSSFMSGFMQAAGGAAFGGFTGMGFFDKGGSYDLAGRKKSLPIFDTGGYMTGGSSRGFPAILHPNEWVLPDKYLKEMIGTIGSGFIRNQTIPMPSRGMASKPDINIYVTGNIDDKSYWRNLYRSKIKPAMEDCNYGRV